MFYNAIKSLAFFLVLVLTEILVGGQVGAKTDTFALNEGKGPLVFQEFVVSREIPVLPSEEYFCGELLMSSMNRACIHSKWTPK